MSEQYADHRMYFPQYRRGRTGIELFDGTILDHARKLGIAIDVDVQCGGRGTCGKCVVRVERGADALSPPTAAENSFDLGESERLACQARVVRPADLYVYVVSAGEYTILSDTVRHKLQLDPAVRRVGDTVVWSGEGGKRSLGAYERCIRGLAVDVGTTTLVCQVLDLESGEALATVARKNPQSAYGDDVISRIDHTMRHDGGLQELQTTVISTINEILQEFADRDGIAAERIYEVVAVGNPTMRNLFLGLDVQTLGVIPFEPPTTEPVNVEAAALGLAVNPHANVYGPALIGGHAGADCLADIIAARMHRAERPCMVIDIGTNGEVAVGNAEHIMTASCAAGGAYEGATVGSGVGAIAGAISNIVIRDGEVHYETIGDEPPVGICGSGLIDLLGEVLAAGIMTKKAKLSGDFHLTDSIRLTQQDVYQLITAKAGLRTDQDLLIEYYGIELEDIDTIYLAGAFGNYINVDNAIAIGLLPDLPDRVAKIGNAALAGAAEMLLSQQIRREAEQCAAGIEHVKPNELEPEFDFLVAENMYF
ncbi:MAG: ASKHA domain-containing protein [Armatimonadota bacterium]|nr:ASKHA domain-containing protein [Armatimonadota bacterium]